MTETLYKAIDDKLARIMHWVEADYYSDWGRWSTKSHNAAMADVDLRRKELRREFLNSLLGVEDSWL